LEPDNRKTYRIKIEEDVIINRSVRAEGLDISEDGIYVYTNRTFLTDTIIDLWFNIDGEKVEISAKVRQSQPGIGFGACFYDFQTETREKIRNYVNQKINDEIKNDE
jgi:hypothetical protein